MGAADPHHIASTQTGVEEQIHSKAFARADRSLRLELATSSSSQVRKPSGFSVDSSFTPIVGSA